MFKILTENVKVSFHIYLIILLRKITRSISFSLSLFHVLTLGSETGDFRWRDQKYGTVFPPHCENRTL